MLVPSSAKVRFALVISKTVTPARRSLIQKLTVSISLSASQRLTVLGSGAVPGLEKIVLTQAANFVQPGSFRNYS